MTHNHPMHVVAAGGLVTNAQGQILLIKDSRHGDWEFPGGQVEEGETLPHALEREIFEETGIRAKVKTLVSIHSNIGKPYIVMMDLSLTG